MIFSALVRRLLQFGRDGRGSQTGLPARHPILRFAQEPDKLAHALDLDDMVLWGALPMLVDAADGEIVKLASCLMNRQLPSCLDIRRQVEEGLRVIDGEPRTTRQARITLVCSNIETALKALSICAADSPARLLFDRYERAPYKRYQDSNTPLNRILIRSGAGAPRDMAELSPVIAGAETFSISRAYVFRDDTEARSVIENTIRTEGHLEEWACHRPAVHGTGRFVGSARLGQRHQRLFAS